jgi:chromosome segregation ATPase
VSISTYTGQVSRLTDELARLRSKLADERKKLADANAKALRAVDALNRTAGVSQMRTKAQEVERHQKAAAGLEKKAADIEKQVAAKQKALASTQASLDRATRAQQKRDDRDAEKRRRADLDHIKTLERARRSSTSLPEAFVPRPRATPAARPGAGEYTDTYDVCLSFAGEQRDYVERIAVALKAAGLRVFYDQDKDIAPKLWGRNLGEYLDYIYRQGSRFCLMFISRDYAEKVWTRHERRSALARAIEDESEYVLPARFDDTELPGFQPTIGYVDLRQIAPATLIEFVLSKLSRSFEG